MGLLWMSAADITFGALTVGAGAEHLLTVVGINMGIILGERTGGGSAGQSAYKKSPVVVAKSMSSLYSFSEHFLVLDTLADFLALEITLPGAVELLLGPLEPLEQHLRPSPHVQHKTKEGELFSPNC